MHRTRLSMLILSALLICILFTSCSDSSSLRLHSQETYTPTASDKSFHTRSSDNEKISASDYLQMTVDKKTMTIGINDKNNNYQWNSLPSEANNSAYAFGVTLCTENGIYILNSQDNSVCLGTASYEKSENSVTVSYVLSDKKETAQKNYEEITDEDIYVAFSVSYSLYEQSMTVTVDCSDIKATPDAVVSQISVLPYFGASYDDSVNDYFLIPDASGAVMHLAKDDINTPSVSVNVYGNDPYANVSGNNASATIPVFGAKRNNNAFAAVITDGDALAVINASRKTNTSPSSVNAVFNISPVAYNEDKTEIYYGKSYQDKITVVYKFLADSNADYIGMAGAAREEFINNNTLSSEGYKSSEDEIPFCITVVGSQDSNKLTTIQQASDILSILKAKGTDNIQLIFKGLLSGGYEQKALGSASILPSLGGKDGYAELYNSAKAVNYTLLTDVNIFSSSKSYPSSASSHTVNAEKASYILSNDLAFRNYRESRLSTRISTSTAIAGFSKRNAEMYAKTSGYKMYLTDISGLSADISRFLSSDVYAGADGVSVSDAGLVLYSDEHSTRQENRDTVDSLLRAIGGNGKLSVRGGNIYTLYSADYISDMEFDTHYNESAAYEPVPFAQAVLHGSLLYSGKAIDAGDPLYRYDMLQCIEYGAIPSFEWIYSTANIFCYDGYLLSERISEITEFYKKADDTLHGVSSSEITNHRKITSNADGKAISGVYCTEYSDGTKIYVNYTGSAVVTPDNVVVGAYDFIKTER